MFEKSVGSVPIVINFLVLYYDCTILQVIQSFITRTTIIFLTRPIHFSIPFTGHEQLELDNRPLYNNLTYIMWHLLDILVEDPFQCLNVSLPLLSHLERVMMFVKDHGIRPTNCPFRRIKCGFQSAISLCIARQKEQLGGGGVEVIIEENEESEVDVDSAVDQSLVGTDFSFEGKKK